MLHLDRAISFVDRAKRGEVLLGLHCSTLSPNSIELGGMSGMDFAVVGMESESVSPHQLEDLLRAGEASGMVTMVKVRRPTPEAVEDAFIAGAQFVTAPHITSAEQLSEVVKAARFANHGGDRGVCAVARYVGYGTKSISSVVDATQTYNPIIPIIEDREALENLDEILEVLQTGIIEIGPYDLSLSLGCENPRGYGNAEVIDAIEMIAAKAKERSIGLLAPVWYQTDLHPTEQMDFMRRELVERGINIIYDGDLYLMKRQLGQMNNLRTK